MRSVQQYVEENAEVERQYRKHFKLTPDETLKVSELFRIFRSLLTALLPVCLDGFWYGTRVC